MVSFVYIKVEDLFYRDVTSNWARHIRMRGSIWVLILMLHIQKLPQRDRIDQLQEYGFAGLGKSGSE